MFKRFLPTIFALTATTAVVAGGAAFTMAGADAPASGAYFGYSTGTVVHGGLVQAATGGPRLLNADEAFSGASVASKGTSAVPAQGPGAKAGQIVNEMSREVQSVLSGVTSTAGGATARGAGLELGWGEVLPAGTPQLPLNAVKLFAPPKASDLKQIGPIAINPLVSASLLRGSGQTDFDPTGCAAGNPIARGLGYAADVRLLNLGRTPLPGGNPLLATAGSSPERRVAQSVSQMSLVPQTNAAGKVLGAVKALSSETRQTIAPVTFFKGMPQEFTIEVLGEWVLQAVAGGVPGSAYVRYAPAGSPTPTTPILRIVQPKLLSPVTKILNFQDLLGKAPVPIIDLPGIARISVGEAARSIGSDGSSRPAGPTASADGTRASAAVDVVRVQLFERRDLLGRMVTGLSDLRIGHMEVRAQVPAGGITCATVAHQAAPAAARPVETRAATAKAAPEVVAAAVEQADAAPAVVPTNVPAPAVQKAHGKLATTGAVISKLVAAGLLLISVGGVLRMRKVRAT